MLHLKYNMNFIYLVRLSKFSFFHRISKNEPEISMREVKFEKWEERLPWVKKYQELLTAPLTPQHCHVLPQLRKEGALTVHQAWAADHKSTPSSISPQDIENKFQVAVNNIVSKFCEPIENNHAKLIHQLDNSAPQANDHELLTEELKEQYVNAAKVRHAAIHDRTFNPRAAARNFSKETPEKIAVDQYEAIREGYKQRYSGVLQQENKILQEKNSELDGIATTLKADINANNDQIKTLRNKLSSLMRKMFKKIEEQASLSAGSPNIAAPTLSEGTIPPPPPMYLMPPLFTPPPTPLDRNLSIAAKPVSAPFVLTPGSITSVRLRSRPVSVPMASPVIEAAVEKSIGHLLVSSLPQQMPIKMQIPNSKPQSSVEDVEKKLDKNAISIINKQNVIAAMQENVKKQKAIISELNRQQRELVDLEEQLILREKQQQELSQLASKTDLNNVETALPPPPPPLPSIKELELFVAKPQSSHVPENSPLPAMKSEKKSRDSLPQAARKDEWMGALESLLKQRRQQEEESEDELENEAESETLLQENKQKARLEFERKQRETKTKEAVLAKHLQKVKEQQRDLEPSPEVVRISEQTTALTGASSTWVQSNRQDVTSLLERFEALGAVTVTPPSIAVIAPIQGVGPVREEARPADDQLRVQVPSAAQESNYNGKIATLLREDAAMQTFYQQLHDDQIFHGALSAVQNLNGLTKAVVLDVLMISDYVTKKRAEVVSKKLSPIDAQRYNDSLDGFYQDALKIRLSNESAEMQLKHLKEAANTHFKIGGTTIRLFADAIIMISALCLTGMVVGGVLIGAGLVTASFFSQRQTSRKREFIERLNNKGTEELLKGTLGA